MASLRAQRARLSHFPTQTPYLPISLPLTSRLQLLQPQLNLRYSSHSPGHGHSKSHTRPSSSAQPTEKRTVPSTTSTSSIPLSDDINPPPSTRPADLALPDSLPDTAPAADKVKRYFSIGRAYLSFYKTGLKNVYHNYRASLPIRRSLGIPANLPTAPPLQAFYAQTKSKKKNADTQILETKTSRSTFQLLHRAAHDVRRMIPFSIILIVCGELTPLLVLAFGNAVTPYTCRVPRQIEKERSQRLSRKTAALSAHAAAVDGSITAPRAGSDEEMRVISQFVNKDWVERASEAEVLRACAVLGLAKTHERPSFLVGLLYRRRLRGFVKYLALDDELMRKCGGVSALEAVEVRVAVEERAGFGVADGEEGWQAERVQRRWLEKWLERGKDD
ncbi:hypothetical protein BJY01DRAFT_52416 [Aspergillus pseudoustus]|uniref:Letm1 RBD domain-containing protein n=1 Tax=Aspergillus pseudoustus TaxID=1810923 RepID=A0ABR4J9P7_9EURO